MYTEKECCFLKSSVKVEINIMVKTLGTLTGSWTVSWTVDWVRVRNQAVDSLTKLSSNSDANLT